MLDLLGRNQDFDEPCGDEPCDDLSSDIASQPACLVHPLVFCPPVEKHARYALVIRKAWGQRIALSRRTATSRHASVNLARIRQEAATIGANEVHVLM